MFRLIFFQYSFCVRRLWILARRCRCRVFHRKINANFTVSFGSALAPRPCNRQVNNALSRARALLKRGFFVNPDRRLCFGARPRRAKIFYIRGLVKPLDTKEEGTLERIKLIQFLSCEASDLLLRSRHSSLETARAQLDEAAELIALGANLMKPRVQGVGTFDLRSVA